MSIVQHSIHCSVRTAAQIAELGQAVGVIGSLLDPVQVDLDQLANHLHVGVRRHFAVRSAKLNVAEWLVEVQSALLADDHRFGGFVQARNQWLALVVLVLANAKVDGQLTMLGIVKLLAIGLANEVNLDPVAIDWLVDVLVELIDADAFAEDRL